ncbi:hypothetical protein TNCV_2602791 [Trichonephila clavipes]|nr:hypothetical protein TNCV_2602791 [Trichonephila clavipes]
MKLKTTNEQYDGVKDSAARCKGSQNKKWTRTGALRFHSDDEVKEAVQDFLKNQPQSFYSKNIDVLSKQWELRYNAPSDLF